jgi:hypothetical protein
LLANFLISRSTVAGTLSILPKYPVSHHTRIGNGNCALLLCRINPNENSALLSLARP